MLSAYEASCFLPNLPTVFGDGNLQAPENYTLTVATLVNRSVLENDESGTILSVRSVFR
jgi:hypothetical protein